MTANSELSQAAFARHLGVAAPTVSRYLKIGIIALNEHGKLPMPGSLHALIAHLSEVAAGRGGSEGVADLSLERARLAKAQCEGQQLKNQIAKGEYLSRTKLQHDLDLIMVSFRNRLLAIPSELPCELPHLTRYDLDALDRHIRDALTQLADQADAMEKAS